MNIAVVDGGGHMLAFRAWTSRFLVSIDIALKKGEDVGPLQQSERGPLGVLQARRPRTGDRGTNAG